MVLRVLLTISMHIDIIVPKFTGDDTATEEIQ